MTNALSPWANLAQQSQSHADLFHLQDALDASHAFVSALEQYIDQERDVITAQANQLATEFWNTVHEAKEDGDPSQRSYFGLRCRRRNNSLELGWFRTTTHVSDGVRKSYPISIPKGQGFKYSMRPFKGAPAAALSMIEVTEEQCAMLRKQWDTLSKLARQLREYKRALKSRE